MAGEFLFEKVEWFDDVVFDQGQGRVRGTAFTPRMIGDFSKKWVVFHVRGDVGTYMNSIMLEPPKSYGESQYLPAGITTMVLGETPAIIGKVVLKRPVPGTLHAHSIPRRHHHRCYRNPALSDYPSPTSVAIVLDRGYPARQRAAMGFKVARSLL